MLGNIWAAAGGLVYPFDMSHTVDEPFDPAGVVAADAGTAGVTAATLFTKRERGGTLLDMGGVPTTNGLLIADEYYHEAEKEGVLTDDAAHWPHPERCGSRSTGWWTLPRRAS